MLVLDRPRHEQIIKEVRAAGARIKLISDGDVGGAIEVAKIGAPVDVLFGIGGTPEGSHLDNSQSDKHVLYPAIGQLRANCCAAVPKTLQLLQHHLQMLLAEMCFHMHVCCPDICSLCISQGCKPSSDQLNRRHPAAAHDCPSRNLSMCDTCIKSCLSHVAVQPLC